jgi:hypothetical protein
MIQMGDILKIINKKCTYKKIINIFTNIIMSRLIKEIQQFIDDITIMNNIMNDCKMNVVNNKLHIIFSDWLNYLEDSS